MSKFGATAERWLEPLRGTETPLASIFGSGFLVIVSVLAGAVGPYSVIAMIGICALAYAVGAVVRFNILHAEPALQAGRASVAARFFERASDIALVPAYVISVTLYLRILSSYTLGFLKLDSDRAEESLTTGVIALILFIGVSKGLKVLEGLERWALYTTLAIIAVLLVAFAVYDLRVVVAGGLRLPDFPHESPWRVLTVLAGALIVVQGFETTRYLGDEYDAETRVRACRNAQLFSTAVYVAFVALATPLMHLMDGGVSDNALLLLAGVVAVWLPAPLVLAAIFSQFSAATADTIGASGNLEEFTRHRLSERATYLLICGLAIALTWTADTLQILALASRAFAFYYFMQCLVAASIARQAAQRLAIGVLGLVLLFITLFAVPVG